MSIPGFDPRVEGAICRFNLRFVQRTGEHSAFLKALSDLWTIAMHRLWEANGLCPAGGVPVLYSTGETVDVLRALCAMDPNLKLAMYQEPFGFGELGAIERAFARVFGYGVYPQWRGAFEQGQFDRCRALIKTVDER